MSLIEKPLIIVDFIKDNLKDLNQQIYDAAKIIGLEQEVKRVESIFIKPNLTYPIFKKGVTTRVEFVRSLINALKEINPGIKIYIGEGEGGYSSFSMTVALKKMGFMELEREFPQVKVVNLSELATRRVIMNIFKSEYSVEIPELFFREVDFSITCPVPKVHCITTISLAIKNQWGCLPDMMRIKNHYVFNQIISKICDILKFKYAFLDGKYGLNRNGPMAGEPVEVNWFAASNSLGAFDMIVTEMMGFDWKKVKHLRVSANLGYLPIRKDINIVGDIGKLRKKFVLKREFWNYFPLLAFGSKQLTHLFYFSIFSKPLHNIMYMVRKRPIGPNESKRDTI